MRVFFLSERLCSLTIGGMHLGLVNGFERSAEIDPADGLWCELHPCGDYLPLCFRLDEEFLHSPPPRFRLYYTERGAAVYAYDFLRADQSLKVIWQKRLDGALLTLTMQGKLQLAVGNETGFHLVDLPDGLADCVPKAVKEGFLLEADGCFALLSRKGEILLFSEGKTTETGELLRAEVPFHDCLGHSAVCAWRGGKLVEYTVRAAGEPTPATFALALFESALIGADPLPFLAENLAKKADSLKEYLGDFRSVALTEDPEKVGLVYERKERVYDVRYFKVEATDGKISNIKPL